MTEEDSVVIYNRILSEEEMLDAEPIFFDGASDYIDVGNHPFNGTIDEVRIECEPIQSNFPIMRDEGKWYSFLNINGNVYIDGAFSSGERIPEEEELAFDMFLEKTIKEVIKEVTGKEVFVIEEE